jgi:hypothetical protein
MDPAQKSGSICAWIQSLEAIATWMVTNVGHGTNGRIHVLNCCSGSSCHGRRNSPITGLEPWNGIVIHL